MAWLEMMGLVEAQALLVAWEGTGEGLHRADADFQRVTSQPPISVRATANELLWRVLEGCGKRLLDRSEAKRLRGRGGGGGGSTGSRDVAKHPRQGSRHWRVIRRPDLGIKYALRHGRSVGRVVRW